MTEDCCAKDHKLSHKAPAFVKINLPKKDERLESLLMKEVKLPFADQTHEVCWEPLTQSLFVTQMSNSTLVRLKCNNKGILKDKQEAWRVGPENGGLHNASISYQNPGHLWLTMQYMNLALLVDVREGEDFLKVKETYQVPTVIKVNGETKHVGGPHCVRESPQTGELWACLKGALDHDNNACAKLSKCCDPIALREAMEEHCKDDDHDIAIPDSYAVWQLDRKKYDPHSPCGAKGGTIYGCLNSPPMASMDHKGNCWVPQDQSETIIYIDREAKEARQLPVPWPKDTKQKHKHTGPGIATAPDGSIWIVQLETMGAMVRIDPETKERVLYELVPPAWVRGIRMIHMDFSKASIPSHHNRIYAIASTLLQDKSTDACFVFNMCNDWKKIVGIRIIPLPSQQSACHRITYCDIEDGDNECDDGSVFITELSKSKILQVKMNHDVIMTKLDEEITKDDEGFECRKYIMTDEVAFGPPDDCVVACD